MCFSFSTRVRALLCVALLAACHSETRVIDTGDGGFGVDANGACVRGGICAELQAGPVENVDLLFVIDNSNSMREEQEALAAALPGLVKTLTSGELSNGSLFAPVKTMHVGVVSTDIGIGDVQGIAGCRFPGNGSLLLHEARLGAPTCKTSYPTFLEYDAASDDANQLEKDFSCISDLGTGGCGFEQQLESMLGALWPSSDVSSLLDSDPQMTTLVGGDAVTFNADFLRSNDPNTVLAIVLVTDEEDCSARDPSLFTPMSQLSPSDPEYNQDLNVRCPMNEDKLFVIERYTEALRALKPRHEELVFFTAIAGVPQSLVNAAALAKVDFSKKDERRAYYDALLDDPRMQNKIIVDPINPMAKKLDTACTSAHGNAYPARRIVELAKQLGENSVVQSICEDDFAPAFDAIATRIAGELTQDCIDEKLPRTDGKVACDLIWDFQDGATGPAADGGLPSIAEGGFVVGVSADADGGWPAGPEIDCSAWPGLENAPGNPAEGHTLCVQKQVAIDSEQALATTTDFGWYYDDFSDERRGACGGADESRISFIAGAEPPPHVKLLLDCNAH